MTKTIDLNADLGESFGPWRMGNDEAMLEVITSANIACGFHAGDPVEMRRIVQLAKKHGVGIGAHPGFDDLKGFGRRRIAGIAREEQQASIIYQIGALQAIARSCGAQVRHVKLHGALANMASKNRELADTCIEAIGQLDKNLIIVTMASTELQSAATAAGASIACEVFADRTYNDDGTLVSRAHPQALIHDPGEAAERVIEMIEKKEITSINGVKIKVTPETICVHGDNQAAVEITKTIRTALESQKFVVSSFASKKM